MPEPRQPTPLPQVSDELLDLLVERVIERHGVLVIDQLADRIVARHGAQLRGRDGEQGPPGRNGNDGRDGRDAPEIDRIIDEVRKRLPPTPHSFEIVPRN